MNEIVAEAAEEPRGVGRGLRARTRGCLPDDVDAIYLGLGELEQAMDWIEKSCVEREDAMVSLGVNPRMDPLRSNPRFQDLLRRIGLPYKPPR